jgi:hypothetical protein
MVRVRLHIGDIFEIPLSRNRKAYGQYVFFDKKMGPLFQVYDLITETGVQPEQLKNAKPLFPPIIVGLKAAIRLGLWTVVGRIPVDGFVYPNFVSTFYNQKSGKAGIWYLWDGERSIRIGDKLPEEFKKMEFLLVWSPYDVVKRIETGEGYFPYRELILYNEYTPITKKE